MSEKKSAGSGRRIRIGLVGCGTVGRGLIELLHEKGAYLKKKYGIDFELCMILGRSKGTLVSPAGLDLAAIAKSISQSGSLHAVDGVQKEPAALGDILDKFSGLGEDGLDILCDATPTDYETGQPSLGVLQAALSRGINAVTCSKGGVGYDLAGLKKLARENCVQIRFESSVMSGTPLINLASGPFAGLAGCEISGVEGIVNGTTNFILTEMAGGMSYEEALAEAMRLGYAEADPTGDVEGFDAAIKVAIMAAEFFDTPIAVGDVERTGISGVTGLDVAKAESSGKRIKLIAGIERNASGIRGYVAPTALDAGHPLAGVSGAANAVCLRTDNLGDVTIIGPGAGARETAHGMLSDMLHIAGAELC